MRAASLTRRTTGRDPTSGRPGSGPAGASMGARGQRLPLLYLLGPLLWLQARHVRRLTQRMPEPPGLRAGTAGCGPLIRLLVTGDSGATGVGAPTEDLALCGQLVRRLSPHHTVEWCVGKTVSAR